jgi:hypothetical protein
MSGETQAEIMWRPQSPIALPTPEQERRIAIRQNDWERCMKKLKKMNKRVPRFHLIYSFFFGVTVSSFSALITSYAQSPMNAASWVLFVYWALFAIGLIFGCIFVYVDKVFRQEQESDVNDIIEEMEGIEEMFPKS